MIAFPLIVPDAPKPQRAAKDERPGVKPAKHGLLRLSLTWHAGRHEMAEAALDLAFPARKRVCRFFCNPFHASLCFRPSESDSPAAKDLF
jgi:hypothetical protein